MTNDAWLGLVDRIRKTCNAVMESVLPLLSPSGEEIDRGSLHVVEFDSPTGKRFRLERELKPRVIDVHESFSGRAGTAATMSYDVSDTEFVDHTELFEEDEYGEWQSVPLHSFGI